ncbi:glutathione peroxidase [Polynucleobacter meluiroseus]|uniref:Glutathione peroxidase n=1 Tax=Polynucleobacter meluiroseus TaxID=1938814 RepID=A0A240DYQ4_9BURK|nr:glutathione peroxidase [Polynucleobacter meluiroseus]SNX28062.1 glutathione peroxidase [Polynucleobacter meluiroseus]
MLPNIPLQRLNGQSESLHDYANKVLLIVNVASECGFTSQYRELQSLYDEFHTQGLEILAFPSNQFGGQEPGTAEQIENFCTVNYGVTFPVFQKTDVNGANTHPLFEYLKHAAPGLLGTEAIKWNFTKFLVNRDGKPVERYASATSPNSIRSEIQKLL